jgi:hypothetical protein
MSHRPYAHIYLSLETHEEILQRMQETLGGRYFTLVCANSLSSENEKFAMLDIYTSQWFADALTGDVKDGAYIRWGTPKLAMGVSSDAKTQGEGRNGKPYDYVHFTFEPGRVIIDHYAPARNFLRWTFVVEDHSQETGPAAFYHEPVFA